nr:ribonuclease H-like domain-containing protein [Tanacetum cinerariifolium]
WQWELILPVGTLSWQWECLVHFIPNIVKLGNFLHWQWEVVLPVGTLITGSGNALCILFPTAITELRRKLELAQKQKDEIQLTVENFENLSKNLSKLIDCQIVDKCKISLAYNAVPSPYTGNFMPLKLDFVVRKNFSSPLIEDWISDSEDEAESKPKIEKKTVKPSFSKIEFVKSKDKTSYKLFHGRTLALSFTRPFGCLVTILNTKDHLGKFDGKADEGLFAGYSLNSKSFREFNNRTRIVEENLHIRYKACDDAESKSSQDDGFQPLSDDGKKVDEDLRQETECKDQKKEDNVNNTNNVNAVGTNGVNVVSANTNNELPFDLEMPALEDISTFNVSSDHEYDDEMLT